MEPELMKANGGEGVAEELHMFTRRRPLERFLLYESRVKYYLVGHTACRREWRMLQISRQEHSHFVCDKACYTENQMMGILSSLASAMEAHGGIKLVMKCYGFIGVIRLLRNAYLILVTHRKKVGLIAGHRVYGCRDVAYVPVVSKEYLSSMPMHQQAASEKARASGMKNNASLNGGSSTGGGVGGGVGNPSGNSSKLKQGSAKAKAAFQEKLRNIKSVSADEKRYLRLFMGVDLCKDFYFSYTYPLWNTLQQNLLLHPQPNSNSKAATQRCPKNQRGEGLKERVREREEEGKGSQEAFVGSTSGFESMFVWNVHLAKHYFQGTGMNQEDKERWIVPLIYGFFDQVKLCSFGKQLKISLVARRSRYFAGTRYLKRGINELGQVANEVETEQIVEAQLDRDLHSCKPSKGREREDLLRLSSIIQLRGSIPLYWSQETSTSLNPRPEIVIRRYDPSYSATKRHFDRLHQRYGKPVIVLNLIKSFEKRPREMILRVEFAQAVDYLNRYHYNVRSSAIRESKASEQKKNKDTGGAGTADGERERRRKGESENNAMSTSELLFVHWDFSKCTKQRGVNVLGAISPVVKSALKSTGLFYTRPVSSAHKEGSATSAAGAADDEESKYEWSKQQGVLRTNCIDCLDRTNVAQFAYGLYALAHQMHVLGITDTDHGHWSKEGSHDGRENLQNAAHVNNLNPRSVLATELMDLYESMGDVIALQYGGSEAHSKFFKRQKGSWEATTQSKDMMTSFRRFYSNTYTDAAKQAAINLFLGHFKPNESPAHIWDLDSDSYLPNLYYKHCYDPTKEAEWKKRNSNKSSDNVEYHEKEEEEEGEEKEGFFHVQKGSPPESSKSEEAAILTANLKRLWHQKARSDRFLTVDPRKTGQMVSIDKLLAQNPLRVSEGFCDFAPLPFKETEDDYRKNLEHFLKEASVQHTNQSKSEEWASKNVPLHFSQNNWDPIFNLKSYEDGNHIVFPSCTDRMSQQQQQQQQQQYSSVRDDVSVDGDAEIYKSYVDMKMSLGENLAMDFNLDTPSVPHNLDDISSNLLNEILMEQESEDLTASDLLWNQLQTSLFDEHGAGAADASTSTYIEAEKLYTTQLIQHFTV